MTIPVTKITNSRIKEVDWDHLTFGDHIADHMFSSEYLNGEWKNPAIVPFHNLTLSPATLALHYGQSVFEGMKAFRMKDGRINVFRIKKHHDRLTNTLERMAMPPISYDFFAESVKQLVAADKDWVPNAAGTSLYIRPFIFANEARFGVKVAEEYLYLIFTGPVATVFMQPIKVKVERTYVRAAKGGTGFAKCAGNYGGAFYPTRLAKAKGYDQVLWTDAKENEYIEESGMMNVMFVIDGKLITPALSGSILDGITRSSLIAIAKDMNLPVEERPISVTELRSAFEKKIISEAFGAGTAAVVAPIGTIGIDKTDYDLPAYNDNSIMFRLRNKLELIRSGQADDVHGWNTIL
ncbi:MAG: branched-chain amino acid aminotransferase [Chitinophagaceae bacterium]|nr:branched-chain amino acid aminotransferase [Chitinophagaceae bacterium]